ncbi:MAG: glycine betaine ABC transporter substrate-binding protein [Bacteroidales bacterium]
MKIKFLKALAVLLGLGLLMSCNPNKKGSSSEDKDVAENKKISVLYPNWSEGIAFTHLAKVMLEDNGYDVKVTPLEPGLIYASLAKGDSDLFFDAWLPNTHEGYWEKFGDKLDKLGESFSNGTTGLVVPSYVDVNSIEELNENADKFDGKIIGIGSGAGIHANTEKVIEEYGLDFEQVTSSGTAMVASLKKHTDKEEPVVITGWKPHHMWANFDLKYLDDPKNVYPKDVCAILSRKGFSEDFPQVKKFLANFNLSEPQLYELMAQIEEVGDPLEASKAYYKENKDEFAGWFPTEDKK